MSFPSGWLRLGVELIKPLCSPFLSKVTDTASFDSQLEQYVSSDYVRSKCVLRGTGVILPVLTAVSADSKISMASAAPTLILTTQPTSMLDTHTVLFVML